MRGVLHCFTGTAGGRGGALWLLVLAFRSAVSATFKKWGGDGDDVIRLVPADRLLVESDSPYLAPSRNRGRRNEPAWVSLTVVRVAAVRGVDPSTLGAETTRNAARLFGLSISRENHS